MPSNLKYTIIRIVRSHSKTTDNKNNARVHTRVRAHIHTHMCTHNVWCTSNCWTLLRRNFSTNRGFSFCIADASTSSISWGLCTRPSYTHWAINHLHLKRSCLERTDPTLSKRCMETEMRLSVLPATLLALILTPIFMYSDTVYKPKNILLFTSTEIQTMTWCGTAAKS